MVTLLPLPLLEVTFRKTSGKIKHFKECVCVSECMCACLYVCMWYNSSICYSGQSKGPAVIFWTNSPGFLRAIPKLGHGLSAGLIWWKRSEEGEAPGGVGLMKDTTWKPSATSHIRTYFAESVIHSNVCTFATKLSSNGCKIKNDTSKNTTRYSTTSIWFCCFWKLSD